MIGFIIFMIVLGAGLLLTFVALIYAKKNQKFFPILTAEQREHDKSFPCLEIYESLYSKKAQTLIKIASVLVILGMMFGGLCIPLSGLHPSGWLIFSLILVIFYWLIVANNTVNACHCRERGPFFERTNETEEPNEETPKVKRLSQPEVRALGKVIFKQIKKSTK